MRVAAGMLVAVSACYSPTVPAGAPCDLALNNCPAGQRCEMTASGAFCGAVPTLVDGPTSNGDGPDGPRPDTAPGCFGVGLIHDVCLTPTPTNDLTIAADRTINTATVGNGNCDSIQAQAGGPSLCMISARTITIASGVKLTAQGTNPLLLVASTTIGISGTIDVASRRGAPQGAGADTTCASSNGNNASVSSGAGGGGAGGSFGTKGGNGGTGRTPGSPTPGGMAGNPITPTALRGGCAGGRGGAAAGSGGDGLGGNGGGAVYLIAGTSITVSATGVINASGSGGDRGDAGSQANGGAGAGGSGGMIGFDAPSVSSSGQVFANGGSGGGGGGGDSTSPGGNGTTSTAAGMAAPGGSGGSGGGGRGGDGSVMATSGNNGANGPNPYCSGGGGGGGAGVIKVYGASPSSLGGTVSPPAT